MILPPNPLYPEEWRILPIHIFPNVKSHYTVSSYGIIHNLATGNYLPLNLYYDENKYTVVNFSTLDGGHRNEGIHRVVLMTFNYFPGCENLEVNHKDGIKHHNWLWNLEWTDTKGNSLHAFNNGLVSIGEDRENSILTNEQAHYICKLIQSGYSTKDICSMVNINGVKDLRRIVCNIKNGSCWKHISSQYDFSNANKVKRLFTNDEIHFICKCFQNYGVKNITTKEILALLGIDLDALDSKQKSVYNTCVSSIRNKKTFKDICNLYNY